MRLRSTHGSGKLRWRSAAKCSALVALSAAVVGGMAATASAITVYNRTAAVAYANVHWNTVVSDDYFWINGSTYNKYTDGHAVPVNEAGEAGGIGDDCAHYVSSVLGTPGGGLTIPSRVLPTYGEPGAAALDELLVGSSLSSHGTTYKYGQLVTSVSQLTPGDVIGYDWDGSGAGSMSGIDHTVVYVGNGLVDCHATSHLGVNWTLGGAADYFFIHITLPDSIVPTTPSNVSPATNTSVSNLTPSLTANVFSDGAIGSTQVAAEWLVNFGRGVAYDSGIDATHLTSLTVPDGKLTVGNTYTWQVRYQDNYGDWSSYSSPTSLSIVAPPVAGDYNNNGVVDLADYVLWRNNQGTSTVLPNDAIGGRIGLAQFDQWRAHFGQTGGISSGALASGAIPEPATLSLIILGALGTWTRRRRRA
jgi:hypothetical protein